MDFALEIIVAAFCLPLAALGLRSIAKPATMGTALAIEPRGAAGLNTIRGVLGGFFFACVSMLALGLTTRDTRWFLAVALLMGLVAIGRIVGIIADGLDRAVIAPLVVELVIGGVLVAAHVGLGWS